MSNGHKRKVILTTRDKKLFYFLFRFKTAGLVDIYQEFFKNLHYSGVTRRLRILEKYKFIQRNVTIDDNQKTVSTFSLSPKGLIELQKVGHLVTRKQLKSNYPDHDLALLKLVNVISKFEMVDQIITENEFLSLELYQKDEALSEMLELKPDAVLKLKVKNSTFLVAMEFEQNGKSASRWKQKLVHYYQSGSVDAVFYFCETTSILKKLVEIDRDLATTEKRKVFFALTKNVTLTNSAGNTFTLN